MVEWSFTMYGLGKGTVVERNSIWASAGRAPVKSTILKTATTALFTTAMIASRKKHPKLVRVVALVSAAGFTAIAVHNGRVISGRR